MPGLATRAVDSMVVTPAGHSHGMGATVDGVDLNSLDEETFKALQRALYTHHVLLIKNQHQLLPSRQLELTRRFDPQSVMESEYKPHKSFKGKPTIAGRAPDVPEAPGVRIVAQGTVPAGHYGTTEPQQLVASTHWTMHKEKLSQEQLDAGETRFQGWHIDGQFSSKADNAARVTTFFAHTLPSGPPVQVRWDDGRGLAPMPAKAGCTAFVSGVGLFNSLSDENKAWVVHSSVEYSPSPFVSIMNCKLRSNGWSIISEGKEIPLEDLPDSLEKAQLVPMVWPNPWTGEPALMFHPTIVRRIHKKASADSPVEIINDIAECRRIMEGLETPHLVSENVYVVPQEEGDLSVWNNRAVRHTAIEYPPSYGPRICHQCNVSGSDDPGNPERLAL